ncbi:uncharacterized protein LOC128222500 [Mya arenaria]|uniref:uncharacterized protein LOC128222500 n=1 Tax=Mya arenaria TaxID=6604 RepID=UPI0022E2F2E3|nr:uncharacterized protein LOC128222500 [Mya arenaria]
MLGIRNRSFYKVAVLCSFLLCVFVVFKIEPKQDLKTLFMRPFQYVEAYLRNVKDEGNVNGQWTGKQAKVTDEENAPALHNKFKEEEHVKRSNNIRIFNITSNAIAYLNKCKRTSLRIPDGSNTPICIYEPKEDIFVSASILKTGWWEKGNVEKVWNLMKPVNDMQFLDIGCNIGAFAIAIAKLGRRVTAVDANIVNLKMLAASLRLGGLEKDVTLIWNGVSNETKYVYLRQARVNVGATMILKATEQHPEDRENTVITVRLDDMLSLFEPKPFFIKMDIEIHEAIALQGAVAFFKEFDVRYVLIEWMHFKNKSNGGQFILDFFIQRSFNPFVPWSQQGLEFKDAYTTWPGDVLWIRSN